MEYAQTIHNYVVEHKQEILNTFKELIRIPSVRDTSSENAPFGKHCAAALEHIERLYEKNGFETLLDRKGGYLYHDLLKSLQRFHR